jgi:hypothetical protein
VRVEAETGVAVEVWAAKAGVAVGVCGAADAGVGEEM